MADFKATTEQWDALEACSHAWPGAWGPCILELRARIEALEARPAPREVFVQRPPDPALRDFVAKLNERVEALELETAQQPTTERSSAAAPAGSLVERVRGIIGLDPVGDGKARAAIREVAAAALAKDLNGQAVFCPTWKMVAQWLEQEAER
jgi:hypothetical protein